MNKNIEIFKNKLLELCKEYDISLMAEPIGYDNSSIIITDNKTNEDVNIQHIN